MTERPIPWNFPRKELHGRPVVKVDDRWFVYLAEGSMIPIPGARFMKVEKFVRGRTRMTQRYGSWIELDRDTAHSDADLLRWCRGNCNSELPSGTFRFSPREWDRRAEDCLSTPFFPELDDPSPLLRELARAELFRRIAEHQLRMNRERRDELVRASSREGHSRRELAELLGISFGRVQQLVHQDVP